MEGRRGGVDAGVDADLLRLEDFVEDFAVAAWLLASVWYL